MQQIKAKGQSVQKIRVETDGQTDRRMDKGDFITSCANGYRHVGRQVGRALNFTANCSVMTFP